MARNLLGQYFGDGSTTTYDLPKSLTGGFILDVQVAGKSVDFDYSDADTVVLVAAPASKAIISFIETDETFVTKQVIASAVEAKANGGAAPAFQIQGTTLAKTKAQGGTFTLLAAADYDRLVMFHVKIDEEYELGTGTLPTDILGETATTNKFMAVTVLVDESNVIASPNQGSDRIFSGVLSAGKACLWTRTAAAGDSTGGITVSVIAVPKA